MTSADARGRLISNPFDHRVTKDGKVLITRGGKAVMTLGGPKAAKLTASLDAAPDEDAVQQILARVTGHYKQGNERQ